MQALNGSIVALITPMHENGEVDFDADVVDDAVEGNADGTTYDANVYAAIS